MPRPGKIEWPPGTESPRARYHGMFLETYYSNHSPYHGTRMSTLCLAPAGVRAFQRVRSLTRLDLWSVNLQPGRWL